MKKSNIEKLKEFYTNQGMKLITCDDKVNKMSQAELKKILNQLGNESTDLLFQIRGKYYILEVVSYCDEDEAYIKVRTLSSYENEYGDMSLIEFLECYGLDEAYEKGELKH